MPPKERRFQQQRFQQVRKHRYERHLSWQKQFVLQARKVAQIDCKNSSTSDNEGQTQSRETHQEKEHTDRVGTFDSDEEDCKVGGDLQGDSEGQTMADDDDGGIDVIPQIAEEVKAPAKKIGGILTLSIIASVIFYLLIVFGVATGLSPKAISNSNLATADAMANLFGHSDLASCSY